MIDDHTGEDDAYPCPTDLIEHIAQIEAGWTLPKPWKAHDEDAAEGRNLTEVSEMLNRWRLHGIVVSAVGTAVGDATTTSEDSR